MTAPTNCLKCSEHHIQGGIMSYATYLYCRRGYMTLTNQWVASWRAKERKVIRPPEWCPERQKGAGE